VIGPFLQAWKARHPSVSGHQGGYDLREIVNSIFYQNRTGCQSAYLPHDLPPKSATYYYFALWRNDGTDQTIHDLLRCQAREKDRSPRLAADGGRPRQPARRRRLEIAVPGTPLMIRPRAAEIVLDQTARCCWRPGPHTSAAVWVTAGSR
jgi:transposase